MEILSVTRDYVLGADNVTYFEVITTTYDDGSEDITKRPAGTAAELTGDTADKILGRAATLAADCQRAGRARSILNEIQSEDTEITAITASSPLAVILSRYQSSLLQTGWQIDEGAGFVSLTFTVNAQGNLRYAVNGGATRAARYYGNVIQLRDYPSNNVHTEFFLSDNGNRYFSLPNRAVIIKKP